jgi:hypothetical protein
MDKQQMLSLWISIFALIVSLVTGYFQYQSRQDTVEERVKIELKMAHQKSPLNPLDLRMISGVNERKDLEAAILVTNMGNTTTRITEVGYQDFDLPKHAFYASANDAKVLSPGEQTLFFLSDVIRIDRQLTDNVVLGQEKNAKIFATSTKGKRFEAPAIIEVAK